MRFWGYFRSSSAHRCRIAFNLKGIAPETVFVHLRKEGGQQKLPAYRAVNPQGLVPALDTGAGVLTQSLAIIEWVDETQPGPALLPEGPMSRARVRAFAQIIACDVHPLQNLRVLDQLRTQFGADQTTLDAWCRRWIEDGLTACEALADEDAPYAFGATPTLADICLIPQMFSAQRFGVDLAPFPTLRRIFDHCMAQDAFARAAPAAQPDAE
ncbi:maleylacetoacetate isomerase [Methylobacterium aquaticum]|uniref:maleylacetoacetate isomerase n=1 Tax=Methylobacterium aquaticum TaxID=270351 RepID=UPI003D16F633